MRTPVGIMLKNGRRAAKKTQVEAAETAGLNRRTISFIESGKYLPSAKTTKKLCDLYGIEKSMEEIAEMLKEEKKTSDELSSSERKLIQAVRNLNLAKAVNLAASIVSHHA